ncbi:NO-inducible flavohemoprotein [Aquabacter sp. CN5-332]|uniref:NO-inducible flavohemoprotein n=1 Tax=Aquabacter sp. CN5-332 TaxID=3156608 RepID=UPI0032B50E2B
MTRPLSPQTIAIVKATVPALAVHGSTITRVMYGRLFKDEHIRALFNHSNQGEGGAQVHALAAAILGYAQNIDNLGALAPTVERIAHKHIGYHILPEHYPFVATALLGAIKEVLGEAASDEVLNAWGEAYWFLADILKAREAVIRSKIEAVTGGWNGWRAFKVAEKRRESEIITSFILRPTDGRPVLRHRPGQYLTFRLGAAGEPAMKRNYSISCAPNDDHYRISVKREANGQGGSRYLHDTIQLGDILEVTPPAGDFFLGDTLQRPVVLLSGGVGLTPMVSMVETIAAAHPGLEAHYVHGTMSSATHAMDAHVRSLARAHGGISVSTFYSEPAPHDALGQSHDVSGMITMDWLKANTPLDEADIYLCGPKPFLRAFVSGLSQAGVLSDRIHYEFFGPADELLAA